MEHAMKCYQVIAAGPGGAQERVGAACATVEDALSVIRASGKTFGQFMPVRLKTYDDDRNLVYEFRCTCEDAAEDAHDFARADCGATYSKIKPAGKRAFDWFIG